MTVKVRNIYIYIYIYIDSVILRYSHGDYEIQIRSRQVRITYISRNRYCIDRV